MSIRCLLLVDALWLVRSTKSPHHNLTNHLWSARSTCLVWCEIERWIVQWSFIHSFPQHAGDDEWMRGSFHDFAYFTVCSLDTNTVELYVGTEKQGGRMTPQGNLTILIGVDAVRVMNRLTASSWIWAYLSFTVIPNDSAIDSNGCSSKNPR